MTLKLKLKKLLKPKVDKPYNIEKFKNQKVRREFQLALPNRFGILQHCADVEEQWSIFKDAITTTAEEKIGRRRGSERDNWIQDRTWLLIDERKKAKSIKDQVKSAEVMKLSNKRYKELNKAVKKSCRKDKNEWFQQKGEEAQNAVRRNDTKNLYRIVRDLSGSQSNSNVPMKDKNGKALLTIEEQTNRWVEHFKEVENQSHPETLHDFDREKT